MRRAAVALSLFLSGPALAAIAVDVVTPNVSSTDPTTGCSFSHAAGTPTLALLWIGLDGDETISGTPTYGGENMTLVTTSDPDTNATAAADQRGHLYQKVSPLSGTRTAAASFSSDDHHACIAITFTGTDTTTPIIESATYDNAGATCATSATTLTLADTTNWMMTFAVYEGADTEPATSYTNCALRSGGETGTSTTGADDGYMSCDSTGNSGSRTHTIDGAQTDECAQISVEISDDAPPSRKRMIVVGGQ